MGKFDDLVSVIIPAFNQEQYLAESIQSVIDQTVKPHEIIVVNDGSTDNTEEVAKSFSQVHYIHQMHKGNHTPARAMNTGLKKVTGRFIVCLASDDKLAPNYFEECLSMFKPLHDVALSFSGCQELFSGYKHTGIVFTGCQEFGASERIREPRTQNSRYTIKPRTLHSRFSVYRQPGGQIGAMMVRSETYLDVGYYDEALHSCDDWDFFIRAGLRGWHIKSINKPLHFARIHNGRVSEHEDHSELYHKYLGMKTYSLFSRFFDASLLAVTNPKYAFSQLQNKLNLLTKYNEAQKYGK